MVRERVGWGGGWGWGGGGGRFLRLNVPYRPFLFPPSRKETGVHGGQSGGGVGEREWWRGECV